MKWYRYLYLGDNARKAKYKTFGLIRKSRFTIDTYIVAISVNPDNILDVYSANNSHILRINHTEIKCML